MAAVVLHHVSGIEPVGTSKVPSETFSIKQCPDQCGSASLLHVPGFFFGVDFVLCVIGLSTASLASVLHPSLRAKNTRTAIRCPPKTERERKMDVALVRSGSDLHQTHAQSVGNGPMPCQTLFITGSQVWTKEKREKRQTFQERFQSAQLARSIGARVDKGGCATVIQTSSAERTGHGREASVGEGYPVMGRFVGHVLAP